MNSLKIAGWNENDARMELSEIINTFSGKTIEEMMNLDPLVVDSAMSCISLMYISNPDGAYTPDSYKKNNNLNKEAFLVGEILEHVRHKGFLYARNHIQEALETESKGDDRLEFAAEKISEFYYDLFEKDGFEHCRFFGSTFNSKFGNVTLFRDLKIECYSGREMLEALVLANEIIRSPYDFLDCASLAISHGFDDVSDYLSFLAKENFDEYMNNQLNREIFIEYKEQHEKLTELLK